MHSSSGQVQARQPNASGEMDDCCPSQARGPLLPDACGRL